MAVRKESSTGKKAPTAKKPAVAKPKKPAATKAKKPAARKAPGKADPRFMDRLSEAIREELLSSERGAPKAESASRGRRAAAPAETREAPAARAGARAAAKAAPAALESRAAPAKPDKPDKPAKPAAAKARRAALLNELKALLDELDEEGLDFLLEQAQVHRYNMEVRRLNEAQERRRAGRPAAPGADAHRSSPLRIERSEDGQTYHIVFEEHYKMFAADEMLALVRIAHANPDPAEGARGLYRWLSRERSDALADLGLKGPGSPGLTDLAELLKRSFAPPPKRG